MNIPSVKYLMREGWTESEAKRIVKGYENASTSINHDMSEAPKDRNILVLTETYHYERVVFDYVKSGEKWIEAHWVDADPRRGTPEGFVPFTGCKTLFTTERLHPIAWSEVPS